jgi:hypothetical protein
MQENMQEKLSYLTDPSKKGYLRTCLLLSAVINRISHQRVFHGRRHRSSKLIYRTTQGLMSSEHERTEVRSIARQVKVDYVRTVRYCTVPGSVVIRQDYHITTLNLRHDGGRKGTRCGGRHTVQYCTVLYLVQYCRPKCSLKGYANIIIRSKWI